MLSKEIVSVHLIDGCIETSINKEFVTPCIGSGTSLSFRVEFLYEIEYCVYQAVIENFEFSLTEFDSKKVKDFLKKSKLNIQLLMWGEEVCPTALAFMLKEDPYAVIAMWVITKH